ncbi:DUF1223 domain-containing protein [Pelagibacterium montanilacus]|uniref:DUF1223 domain-containing protein n=1 Tax=Pelagibacterium montanilacus TaxID=2185280 RepID=UPI0013DE7D59|nr:DUF1223 domain-containing protein [Pelagibacterium montanilacus]
MIRHIGLVVCSALALGTAPLVAEETAQPRAVVELFTSQGCSSCPPADALLAQLGARDDIIALAYHVDYWDYVGWEDTFALPAHGELQKSYASLWGKNRVYTPQFVVNGAVGVPGSQIAGIGDVLAQQSLPVGVVLARGDQQDLAVEIPGNGQFSDAVIWLVSFRERGDVTIERGENSGKSLSYTHIVTGRQAVGMWSAREGASLRLPMPEITSPSSDGLAILVQEKVGELPGPIVGAAVIDATP